jgi:hypothetical protein
MRRLTDSQVRQILLDTFRQELAIPTLAEPEPSLGGLRAVGASSTTFSTRGVETLEAMATSVAEQVLAAQQSPWWMPCDPQQTACVTQSIQTLGQTLWRRPLTEEEANQLTRVSDVAREALGDPRTAMVYAVSAMLQSPNFLFRIEIGEDDGRGGRRFTDHELASRLSFFLWNTAPDDLLLAAADRGELSTDEGLFQQAQRMLSHDNARRGLRVFFTDQLGLQELDELIKDPMVFEHFTHELGPDAREETLRLLEYYALDVDADFRDVMTTKEVFLNPNLAALYGVPAPERDQWALTTFPEDSQRGGLLSQASFLSLEGHSVSSSATLRGKALRTKLLCHAIPPPPVSVDTSIPEPSGNTLTLRDRVAEHLENPSCAGCHKLTDPIGLALENYDGIGRWREQDNGVDIDVTGELDGKPFDGPAQLSEVVRNHQDFPRCLVRTMSRYATGHVESREETRWINQLNERFSHHGYEIEPLILELIMSPIFRQPGILAEEQ